MDSMNLLRVAGWNLPWLRHGFSTRQGGETEVYGGRTLNVGWTKEDDPAIVARNRERFAKAIGGSREQARPLVTVRQVHGNRVHVVRAEDGVFEGKLQTADGKAVLEGDGLVTDVAGVLIAVGTADCVPVLVVDPVRHAVGAFHAGWRGTAAAIAQQGIATMQQIYGSLPEDLMAAIGPSIGACCYTVGEEVWSRFHARFGWAEDVFRKEATNDRGPQWQVDLWESNRRQLLDGGLMPERITVVGECTACTRKDGERRYFSHRAERGHTGRMLSAIGIFDGE
jgi:YfiH family protein